MGWFAITVISVVSAATAVEGVLIYLLAVGLGRLIFEHGRFVKSVYAGFAACDQNFANVGKTFHELATMLGGATGADPAKLPDLPPPTSTGGNLPN